MPSRHCLPRLKAPLLAAAVGSLAVMAAAARADVKLPAVLSDHMVLQQQMPVPVWGTADPGEELTVTFGEQKLSTKAANDGTWAVKLAPLTASDKPAELTVAGKNTVKLTDVLVGEVWIASGQSNMEMGIQQVKDAQKEIAAADHPQLRLFSVPKNVADEPQTALKAQPTNAPRTKTDQGKWLASTPENVIVGEWGGFSAAGYFFGRDVQAALKVPVGVIHTSWGGTPAESWAQKSYLEKDEELKPIVETFQKNAANYPKQLEAWKAAAEKAKAAGQKEPKRPDDPANNPWKPAGLYNGMVAPVVPFACRGAVWYQGESNAGRAMQYRKLLPVMIKSWRDAWGEPEMAFLIVQLANYQAPPKEPVEKDGWAELREAQWLTAQQPHNGIATAVDLADVDKPGDIHPHDKQGVGRRLSLVALNKVYGKKDVADTGPVFDSMQVSGMEAKVKFKFAEGLQAKGGDKIKGFQIAGEDKKWAWADAKIDGDAVVLSSPKVEKPTAVRYDWAQNPEGNLYNKADLPAMPFRTDVPEAK